MRKAVLHNFALYTFLAISLAYLVLLEFLGRKIPDNQPWSPPRYDSFLETLLSLEVWGWIWARIGLNYWYQAPIAVPVGLLGGGLGVGIPVLAEEMGVGHAGTLLPRAAHYEDVDRIPIDAPSGAWRVFDAGRAWALSAAGLLGICGGAGAVVWGAPSALTVWGVGAGVGLALLGAAAAASAAVGWYVVAVYLWEWAAESLARVSR